MWSPCEARAAVVRNARAILGPCAEPWPGGDLPPSARLLKWVNRAVNERTRHRLASFLALSQQAFTRSNAFTRLKHSRDSSARKSRDAQGHGPPPQSVGEGVGAEYAHMWRPVGATAQPVPVQLAPLDGPGPSDTRYRASSAGPPILTLSSPHPRFTLGHCTRRKWSQRALRTSCPAPFRSRSARLPCKCAVCPAGTRVTWTPCTLPSRADPTPALPR